MTWSLVAAISAVAAVAARPPSSFVPPIAERYVSLSDAVAAALTSHPAVVAFGEYHQTAATKSIPSALHRFTEDVLPALAGRLSHLVVETWIATGRCGAVEQAVTEDVRSTTKRPATTGDEIEALLRAAASHNVSPRILSVTCADYEAMRPPGGAAVDYDRVLRITAHALEVAGLAAWDEDRTRYARWKPSSDESVFRPAVAIYGGALHNDVNPQPQLASYTFSPRLMQATLGQYVEIDLVVPEYARLNPSLRAESWWSVYLRARRPRATVLIRRGPRSFVIVAAEP